MTRTPPTLDPRVLPLIFPENRRFGRSTRWRSRYWCAWWATHLWTSRLAPCPWPLPWSTSTPVGDSQHHGKEWPVCAGAATGETPPETPCASRMLPFEELPRLAPFGVWVWYSTRGLYLHMWKPPGVPPWNPFGCRQAVQMVTIEALPV